MGNDTLCIDMDGFRFFEEVIGPKDGKIRFDDREPICWDDIEDVQRKNASPVAIEDGEAEEGAVGQAGETVEVPGTHLLSGAYPNPFNAQATFQLAVSKRQQVRVVLYDVLGREVDQLYEGTVDAFRRYAFNVDGARLHSGLYLYVVTGETFRDTDTMLVIK